MTIGEKVSEKEITTTRASLELLYNVSRELAAALDLHTVLQRVLFLSMRSVGAISGSVIVLDDNGLPVESAIITGAQVHDHTTQQLRITFERGLAGWVARNNQAVLVPNTSKDERWVRRPDDAEDRTGPKSALSAPVLARDKLVGVMTLVHPTPGFFTLDHVALIQAIADQAGVAILNARLYAESQRQARVMTALAESAAVITASLNLEDVLQRILEQITLALNVEVVSLALIDTRSRQLVFRASTGKQDKSFVGHRLELGQSIAGWVAREGRGLVVPDATLDARFSPEIDQKLGFTTKAVACAPIRSRGQVIGVLEALNPLNLVFDPDALLVLTGIGSLAGTAIRHARLFERLQAAHLRYRELFEASIEPILVTDWDGRILESNRQAELAIGMEAERLRQNSIEQLHAADLQRLGLGYARLRDGSMISYESTLLAEGGREIPIEVYAREVHIDGISHVQWILRDITERKNLDTLRDDLISMIYHDLRSPLANIVSSLDVVNTLLSDSEKTTVGSLLNIAVRSTERIQRLTNSLLDIRQLESGHPVVNRQPAEVGALLKEAADAVRPLAESKGQALEVSPAGQLPQVLVDSDMIRRVMINLMENAHKYSPAQTTIRITARLDGPGQVCVAVQDNGPGIPAVEHKRIFDKFTRLHGKDGPKGLGLGLAFCRLAIEGHGGRIWVESTPGEGAQFLFTLPAVKSNTAALTGA